MSGTSHSAETRVEGLLARLRLGENLEVEALARFALAGERDVGVDGHLLERVVRRVPRQHAGKVARACAEKASRAPRSQDAGMARARGAARPPKPWNASRDAPVATKKGISVAL